MIRHRIPILLALLSCAFLSLSFAVPAPLAQREFLVVGPWDGSDSGKWILAMSPPGATSVTCHDPPSNNTTQGWAEEIVSVINSKPGYTASVVGSAGIGWKIQVSYTNAFVLHVGPGASCPAPDPNDLRRVDTSQARPLAAGVTIVEMGPASVPTVSEWALIVLSLGLAGAAAWVLHRRRKSASVPS